MMVVEILLKKENESQSDPPVSTDGSENKLKGLALLKILILQKEIVKIEDRQEYTLFSLES